MRSRSRSRVRTRQTLTADLPSRGPRPWSRHSPPALRWNGGRGWGCANLERVQITGSSCRRAHRRLPSRCADALRRVRRGAARRGGRRRWTPASSTSLRVPGRIVRRGRPLGVRELALERINSLRSRLLIAASVALRSRAAAPNDSARLTPACASLPSVALRPRVVARSPMTGRRCGDDGDEWRSETLIQSAGVLMMWRATPLRPGSAGRTRRSPVRWHSPDLPVRLPIRPRGFATGFPRRSNPAHRFF